MYTCHNYMIYAGGGEVCVACIMFAVEAVCCL